MANFVRHASGDGQHRLSEVANVGGGGPCSSTDATMARAAGVRKVVGWSTSDQAPAVEME